MQENGFTKTIPLSVTIFELTIFLCLLYLDALVNDGEIWGVKCENLTLKQSLKLFALSRNSISRSDSDISTEVLFVSSESYFREFLGSVPGKLAETVSFAFSLEK